MAWGWNGRAAAERVESSCIEENQFWSSQRARLRFSFSILLHPAKISLASEDAYTLHSPPSGVSHPGGNVCNCFTGCDGLTVKKACSRVGLLSIKGQHVASHTQVHASTPRVGMVHSGQWQN